MSGEFDVVIVGLGPVGGVMAALLGQRGVKTLVVDKLPSQFPHPRAIGFDHEIMRVVQDIGLAEEIAPYIVPYRPTEYRGVGGKVIARYDSLPEPYPQGWSPSYVFTQPPFEEEVRKSLRRYPSVEVRLSTTLETFQVDEDGGVLTLTHAEGWTETVRGRYVVGADGGASTVRRALGVEFEDLGFDEPWMVVDVVANETGLAKLPDNIIQYCDPSRPCTYVLGPDNLRRWELMLLPGEAPEEMNQEAVIWRLLSPWLEPSDGTLWRASTYVFHALVANDWRRGRVFLMGDAAHMTPPFMAQGMCQGIRDAANLAWKLDLVLKGQAGAELLDSYQAERRPHVRATTETAKSFGRIICELDLEQARARDARMLAEAGDPPRLKIRQNLIPPLAGGAILAEQGAPVGALFPQPKILSGDKTVLMDDFTGTGFRLVLAAEAGAEALPVSARADWRTGLGVTLVFVQPAGTSRVSGDGELVVVEADNLLADWFRANGVVAALVRPDNYLFAVARNVGEIPDLAASLKARIFTA